MSMDTPTAEHNSEDCDKDWLVDDWKESCQKISADRERSLFHDQHCMGKLQYYYIKLIGTVVLLKWHCGNNS